jgi:hypothetical protein
MGQRPRAKPKRKSRKNTDKEQSERFIEAARAIGVDETGKEFDRALKRLVPARKARQKST